MSYIVIITFILIIIFPNDVEEFCGKGVIQKETKKICVLHKSNKNKVNKKIKYKKKSSIEEPIGS